jgi:hypothetical protein
MAQNKLHKPISLAILTALTLFFFWKILLTNLILSGVDVFLYFYPYKAYVAEALRQGRLPLWNPHLFMGVPLAANSQVGLFYPLNWLFIWLDAPKQVAWSIGLHITLAAMFMLTFARQSLQLAWPASLVVAILFAFGGYLGAQVEHINQLQAAAWLPLLFLLYDLGLHRSEREHSYATGNENGIAGALPPKRRYSHSRRRWFWFLLLALTIALILLAGHAQTAFIALVGLGLYALWQAIFESTALRTTYSALRHHLISLSDRLLTFLWPLAIATTLAIALAAIQLLPTVELSGLSIRRGGLTLQEVVSFSLRPSTLHYTLLPPINVDLTQIMGQAFSEWVAYLGVSGLTLALLGSLISIWRPAARRFVFLSGSGLILSFGLYTGPLYLALYYLVPGFNLFRVPARWLLPYAFGMAVLAGFGFEALLTPDTLSARLAATWRWLRRGRGERLLLPAIPTIFLLTLIVWKTPPLTTLIIWLALTVVTFGLIYECVSLRVGRLLAFSPTRPLANSRLDRAMVHNSHNAIAPLALIILLIAELFWAAQVLNYNQPTAPQAYHSMRNAIAFLLTTDSPDNTPPDRFLSLSGITYDPGDLSDLQHIFSNRLSDQALYDLVVAVKEKEVLFFNLPLIYGLHSVDGYDGGILPLAQFITLQQLFLPSTDLSLDGRLREKLRFVPPGRLLSLLNTRWIITDKVFDVWIDGIFYDLQFPARLAPGQTLTTADIPHFGATAIGLVSHLEGAIALPNGSQVAEVTLTFADGSHHTFSLQAGIDTAEGRYPTDVDVAHAQATIGVAWPYTADGVDYTSVYRLANPEQTSLTNPVISSKQIVDISVKATLPTGQFVLRGVSLIHQPTTTSRSIILSTEGNYRQVHSGDVKVYENLAVLPRTFIVHQTQFASTATQAITLLQNSQFNPSQNLIRVSQHDQPLGSRTLGQPSLQDTATIVSYAPERVEIITNLNSPGWLVLSDTYYPGWQATVDGRLIEIVQANISFRAVEVPQGVHTVIFEFKPRSFQWGAVISGIALLGLIIGLVVMAVR